MFPRLLVIGAGSGGLAAAQKATAEAHVGGTCVNEGCVPTKMLMYAARLAEQFDAECVDWGKMKAGRDAYVGKLRRRHREKLEESGITFIEGTAKFICDRKLEVGESLYGAEHIVIAVGSSQ